jgi:hypothetical protein
MMMGHYEEVYITHSNYIFTSAVLSQPESAVYLNIDANAPGCRAHFRCSFSSLKMKFKKRDAVGLVYYIQTHGSLFFPSFSAK